MGGVEATRRIRAIENGYFYATSAPPSVHSPPLPKPAYIVGMSASIESPVDWLAVGLDQMLPKPFSSSDIEELMLAMYSSQSLAAAVPVAVAAEPGLVPGALNAASS